MKKLIMMVALMPLMASAGSLWWMDPNTGISWRYTIGDDGCVTLGIGSSDYPAVSTSITGCLTIPSSVDGRSVTRIGNYAFYNCSGLESVIIPSSVRSIGRDAFYGTKFLDDHPDGWVIVNDCLLKYKGVCPEELVVPNNVKFVAAGALSGCKGLVKITLPFVGGSHFCNSGQEDSVLGYIFGTSSYDGGTVTPQYYGENTYTYLYQHYCIPSSLRTVVLTGGGITYGAFSCCSGLTSITLPYGERFIPRFAFEYCSGLTEVAIPSTVTSIGDFAFRGCSGLTSVTIPTNVMSIGSSAFSGCSGLASMTLPFVGSRRGNSGGEEALLGYIFGTSSCSGTTATRQCYDSTKYLTYYIPSSLKSVVITDETKIGYGAFYECGMIESVTIPSSVTNIGAYAFSWCSGLSAVCIDDLSAWCGIVFESDAANPLVYAHKLLIGGKEVVDLQISKEVTGISAHAFEYCSGLKSVTIPSSVTSIGERAFAFCDGLTSVTIPSSVTSIGYEAFYNCSGLTSVTIPEGVMSIGDGAFSGCSGLTSVTIPTSMTRIGAGAFYNCRGLTSMTIPSSVTEIGYEAFSGCSGLTSVTIPACVTKLSTTFPSAYTKIKEVVILEGVTSIGQSAFSGCSRLTSVTIPSSVTSISDSAFASTKLLSDHTDGLVIVDNCLIKYKGACSGEVVIPNGVRLVADSAFYNCSGLTSVTIPSSVTSIGERAFSRCANIKSATLPAKFTMSSVFPDSYANMTSITIPADATYICDGAFSGCSKITSIDIPPSVTRIGSVAFSGCSGLTMVTIPTNVTSVGSAAFSDCSGLTAVHIDDLAAWCGISFDSADANPLYYTKKLYLNGKEVIYLNIPQGVGEVKPYAFYNCNRIMSVSIPSSVTRIGEWAFYGCSQLTSMIIPSGVKSIGERAFSDCSGLTSVTIPTSMTRIGAGAFYNCRGLTSMTIPSSVTEIGEGAFAYCSGIKTVTMPGRFALKEVFPSNYSSIRDVTILAGEKVLNKEVFAGCTGLKTVVIPEGVTTLGEDLFYNLWNITELTNPSTVTSIGGYALYGCSSLKAIHVSNNGDIEALKQMLYESGFDTTGITFDHVKAPDLTYCKVTLDARGGSAAWTETEVVSGGSIGELPPATREGYEFLGWWTSAVGGTQVTAATVVTEDVTFYAQWRVDTSDVEEFWSADEGFSSEVANVYDGYVIGTDFSVVGIVQVKTTKQNSSDVVTATATVTDANGMKWSYSKGVVTVDGEVTGLKCTAKGCAVTEFGVTLGKNGMEGEWGEYVIFGARNGMGTKGDEMMAELEHYKGKWSVTVCGDRNVAAPAVRLQLNVQAKGVVKIAGNWENGAKVSASAQLVMGDGFVYVPVMVKSMKTSPALNALLRIDPNAAATGMSPPQAVTLLSGGELVAGGRTAEIQ